MTASSSLAAHMEVRPLASLASVLVSNVDKLSSDHELPVRLCNYTDVYKNAEVHPQLELMEATATRAEIARFKLRIGDTIITKDSETADDIGIPAFVTGAAEDFVCGYHLAIARPDPSKIHPKYLYWWLASREAAQQWEVRASGVTRVGLRQSDIRGFPLTVYKEVKDQCAIADFLDEETTQIDAMIAAQRRLVAVLEERRAVVIDRTVLSGVRPSKVRASHVPWIGDIPAAWDVQRIGNLGRAHIGLTFDPADIVQGEDEGYLVLRAGNIQNGKLAFDDNLYVDVDVPGPLRLRVGDLLICSRNGSARLIGKNVLISPEVAGQTWGAFMSVLRSPMNEYLRWVLNSSIFRQQIGLFATSTINQLTSGMLHSMRVPVPPPDERVQIVAHISRSTARIDDMIDAADESIALMRERRAALISAAVTGRIDPRTGNERVVAV